MKVTLGFERTVLAVVYSREYYTSAVLVQYDTKLGHTSSGNLFIN
jgi:hypothetical protein